jgi:hypothetical protein
MPWYSQPQTRDQGTGGLTVARFRGQRLRRSVRLRLLLGFPEDGSVNQSIFP